MFIIKINLFKIIEKCKKEKQYIAKEYVIENNNVLNKKKINKIQV